MNYATSPVGALIDATESFCLVKAIYHDFESWQKATEIFTKSKDRDCFAMPGRKFTVQYISLTMNHPMQAALFVDQDNTIFGSWSVADNFGHCATIVKADQLDLQTIMRVMNHVYYDGDTRTKVTTSPPFLVFEAARRSLERHAVYQEKINNQKT